VISFGTVHGHPDLPEIPLGTIDVRWMPIVAERGWVATRRHDAQATTFGGALPAAQATRAAVIKATPA
jgi:hypothetical protein